MTTAVARPSAHGTPSVTPYARATAIRNEPAVLCEDVVKRFYRYEHRTRSMRELFVRSVLGRPIHQRHAEFMLRGLTLRVERGESLALVGGNGSGKSTALRLIAGIYQPTSGRVRTNGRVAAIIDLGVGFHPDLTGAENVIQYASALGLGRRETADRFEEIVDFAEVNDFIAEPVKFYSSGMLARLAFAVALICREPEILIVDEALSVGDFSFQARCLARLREVHERGTTLILVSHVPEMLRELCTRAAWLDHGQLRMVGAIDDVLDLYMGESKEPDRIPV